MFRDEEERLQVPLDAMIHPVIPVLYASSKKKFIAGLDSTFLINLPRVVSSTSFSIAWNEDGLFLCMPLSHEGPYLPQWPKYKSGDAIEVCIDTRNMKSFRLLHRYCHQFILFPEALEGISSREITQFRVEQTRKLSPDNSVSVEIIQKKNKSHFLAYFSSDALYGWTVDEIQAIGFAFCLYTSTPSVSVVDSFPLSTKKVSLEHVPYRWSTLQVRKNLDGTS